MLPGRGHAWAAEHVGDTGVGTWGGDTRSPQHRLSVPKLGAAWCMEDAPAPARPRWLQPY